MPKKTQPEDKLTSEWETRIQVQISTETSNWSSLRSVTTVILSCTFPPVCLEQIWKWKQKNTRRKPISWTFLYCWEEQSPGIHFAFLTLFGRWSRVSRHSQSWAQRWVWIFIQMSYLTASSFLWIPQKEWICVFDDFNLSTNYYRTNSPVWTWHMRFPLLPVNQGLLSKLANLSPLWQEQHRGESVQLYEAPFHQLGGMSGAAAPHLPIHSRTGPQWEPLVTTGMMLGCSPAASSASCSSEFPWQLVCWDISSTQLKSGASLLSVFPLRSQML